MQETEHVIGRVRRMELIFDTLRDAVLYHPKSVLEDASLREMLQALAHYYENGEWLEDYSCDERGELPPDLKRGVLSQDGVYDLLCEIDRLSAPGE